MARRLTIAVALLVAFGLPVSSLAESFQRFSSRTVGVRVDVLVTNGRIPVVGLTAADFELRDNGVLQSIDAVDASGPINVVLALDVSSSTDGRRQADLRRASDALLSGLVSGDRAAVTTFSHVVTARSALTEDFASVRTSLARIRPSGETAVMDGVFVALMTAQAQPGRSLLVVCTDGYDTASWLTSGEVLEAAKRSNAVIYAVTAAEGGAQSDLKELTDATGGQTMKVASSAELTDTFRRVLTDFRSRYVLTFTPRDVDPGGMHRLDVRVKRPNLTVKARPGYVGLSASNR
jgi:Ca-activated chloride channel family protein